MGVKVAEVCTVKTCSSWDVGQLEIAQDAAADPLEHMQELDTVAAKFEVPLDVVRSKASCLAAARIPPLSAVVMGVCAPY
jgi:hypothetical protein